MGFVFLKKTFDSKTKNHRAFLQVRIYTLDFLKIFFKYTREKNRPAL